jgi:exodeoxyribonuclease VII large subunit
MKFRPEDGLRVTVRGSISVYEARGDYQIYVESLEPVGLGALQLAFEQLKKRLEGEGLFSQERKKPLPVLPRCIGLITSPSGAAVRDVVRILRRRFPNVQLTLYPVRVQGEGAAGEIVRALQFFNRRQSVDVLILARGGGSMEDLWSFNADFVADVRASTPSAAAELVVQTRREFDKHISELRDSLTSLIRYRLSNSSRRVHELAARRGFRRPVDLLRQQRQRSDEMTSRLALGLRARLEQSRKRFNVTHLRIVSFDFHKQIVRLRNRTNDFAARIELGLRARLAQSRRRYAADHLRLVSFDFRRKVAALRLLLERRQTELAKRGERALRAKRERLERLRLQLEERNPRQILQRGYAIATDVAGRVLTSSDQVLVGNIVNVELHQGKLITEVKAKE